MYYSYVSEAPKHITGDWFKRLFDIVVASCALAVLSPVMFIVAVAVWLDSPGPIIFRQQRVGRFGKPFTLLKFRSMSNRSDDAIHRQAIKRLWAGEKLSDDPEAPFKMTTDPRVTRVGAFIRRTSIDELPQLINVLRGEMSIVGPRPMIRYELEQFKPWHHERHDVRPGITGLAQVKSRGRANLDDILRLDVEYARSRNWWRDVLLILATIPVVLRGSGAR